jgi:carbon-monoxide dehydrogenase large subunit
MGRIGESVARLEDFPLLTGRGRFAADIGFPGQVHMRVARSPVAAGRIVAIDTGAARDAPGVLAVWTGADVADLPPIAFRMTWVPGLDRYRQPILAQGRVRYVGEPIAAVFADDPYRAEDAAELVFADIEELPAQLRAIDPPGEFDDGVSTDPATVAKGYGDLDAAFAAAAHVLELELAVGRHTGMPLETRGAIARFDPGLDRLELHGAAKVPHANRNFIAEMLGLSPGRMHLFEGHVGGGFGIRGELYPEDVLVCLAALRLGRPVKWIEDRREHLLAANHSRDQVHRIRLAVDRSGFVLGVDDEFWVDQGAYIRTHAATVTDLAAAMLPGPYRFPAYRSRGHIRLTNKTPAGTYRAPGRYETTFVRERAMDAVAALLGADPVTIRRINFIGAGEMPFDRGIEALGTPVVYDSADFEGLLDKLLAHVDYDALQRKCAMRRGRGEHVGIGIACFVEKSGLGPFDEVHLSVDAGGDVEAVTGVASLGQGVETVIAQIVADALGVDYRKVRVVHGQTDRIGRGMGAFASRVTVMTGSAATLAARDLRRRICEKAAELLQHPVGSLSIDGGRIAVSGMPAMSCAPLRPMAAGCGPRRPSRRGT